MIRGVSLAFEAWTGENPYVWTRRRNDVSLMIDNLVKEARGKEINFSKIDAANDWDRVCFIDSQTEDAVVSSIVGSEKFKLSVFNWTSKEKVTVVIFMDGKDSAYVVFYPLKKHDFTALNGSCLKKE
jgi:hypothetical protein